MEGINVTRSVARTNCKIAVSDFVCVQANGSSFGAPLELQKCERYELVEQDERDERKE